MEALTQGFESGAIHFSTDDRQLVLRPYGLINMDIEAKRKGGEMKLTPQIPVERRGGRTP